MTASRTTPGPPGGLILRPAPVAAKVAATATEVRSDPAAWLQRELDVTMFLGQAAVLEAALARLTARLDLESAALQVLHGDAGTSNLMATVTGWVWHDFEDTCAGPVGWDLAATTASPRLDSARILAAYGPADLRQLAVCEQLRRLNLTVWYALYAERFPALRPRAAELLASWPAP